MNDDMSQQSTYALLRGTDTGPVRLGPLLEYEAHIEPDGLFVYWLGFRNYYFNVNLGALIAYLLSAPFRWFLRRLEPRLLWRVFPKYGIEPAYVIRWDELDHFKFDDYSFSKTGGSVFNQGTIHFDLLDGTSHDFVLPHETDPDRFQGDLVQHLRRAGITGRSDEAAS